MTISDITHKIVYTTKEKLDTIPITNGYIIFCEDEQVIYFDFNDIRQRYDKIVLLTSESERTLLTGVNGSFYFVKDTNVLWYYSDGWNKITLQTSDFPTALKNPNALTIQFNGTTNQTYDGSSAKTVNVTPSSIGAAADDHTHNYAGSSSAGGAADSAVKLQTSRKLGNASFDGTKDVTLSEMGIINPIEITKAEYEALKTAGTLDMTAYYNIIDDYDSVTIIDDTTVNDKFVYSSSKTESTYAKKSTVVDAVLSASSWSGSSAPYTYTLSVSGVTESNINEINFSASATDTQIEAYQNAILKDGGQSSGEIILKATGDKPTIDIPITIIVRHDV